IVFITLIGLILLFVLQSQSIKLGFPVWSMYMFVIYSFISYFWAINQEETLTKSKTLLLLWMMFVLLWIFFSKYHFEEFIIKTLLVAGLALSFYILYFYGVSEYFNGLLTGKR